ncbi:DUF935 domain-containing protein [Delftia acidovorans]|uniref:DUF935 domain-containing protein n=1 Tax=Delftia acidovorans TaxID=80866 RepID=UPI0022ABB273|nr:DUF935 family protein [Delftia acidovorans]WAT87284.1 DUF935 family protein [Delftia acidovorans]
MTRGIYVSPTEFVSFAETKKPTAPLFDEIATRARSGDLFGLGFLLPNPDPILKRQGKDIRVYRDLRSDAHVGGCIRRRKAAVKNLELRVNREKASARSTRLARDIFSSLDTDTLLNELLDAVLYGWQPLELNWGMLGGALAPLSVVGKPGEWFMFDQEAQLRFRSRQQPMTGEELPARKFLLARQEASYANPYGFADLSMCFWPTVFKRGGLKFWVTFTEKYGTPWLVAKTPRGTPKHQNDELLDSLESMIQDAVAVIPDDASVDTLEASDRAGSTDLYKELLMFCRSEVSIALLGQNQSTEASSTRASAVAGLEVAAEIRDGDARMVEATLNQMLRWVVDLNEGPQAPAPKVELYEEEEVNQAQAARDKSLTESGVKFKPAYWKRTYRLQEGDIEEAVADQPPATVNTPAEFAEAAGTVPPDAAQALGTGTAPTMAGWVAQLRGLVNTHSDPQALQEALLDAYSDLPTQELTELMAMAFELAHLQGRDKVEQESARA